MASLRYIPFHSRLPSSEYAGGPETSESAGSLASSRLCSMRTSSRIGSSEFGRSSSASSPLRIADTSGGVLFALVASRLDGVRGSGLFLRASKPWVSGIWTDPGSSIAGAVGNELGVWRA